MPKPVWTDTQIIQQMDSGAHWSGTNLTYGFPSTASWFPYGESLGFSPLSATQQATATLAIKLWDDLIVPHVTLVADGASANIKFSNTTTNIGYAQAYFPGGSSASGSVWFKWTANFDGPVTIDITATDVGSGIHHGRGWVSPIARYCIAAHSFPGT